MPATYSYNEAIQDAAREVAAYLDAADGDPVFRMRMLLDIVGRFEQLKRPTRTRRRLAATAQPMPDVMSGQVRRRWQDREPNAETNAALRESLDGDVKPPRNPRQP